MRVRVLLNVAHSDDTPGKRSPDGSFREFYFSRKVCRRIAELLRTEGVASTIIEQEDAKSLPDVVQCANAYSSLENCILVSVHVNAAGKGDKWYNASGWSAYTSKGTTRADSLATCLYKAAKELLPSGMKLRTDYSDGDPDLESDFFVLRKTRCPAVLTENLFMDCRDDVAYLMSAEGLETIAKLHVKGIMDYLQSL